MAEIYSVAQIRAAFAKHAREDDWGVPAFYEEGLIAALRGQYDSDTLGTTTTAGAGTVYRVLSSDGDEHTERLYHDKEAAERWAKTLNDANGDGYAWVDPMEVR